MNITKKYWSKLLFILLIGLLMACSKEYTNISQPTEGGAFVPQARHAELFSGHHRLLFVWPNPDPRVAHVIIYWNDRQDSLKHLLSPNTDTLRLSLNDLEEGEHHLDVITFNAAGNTSGKVLLSGHVYGERYVETWEKRNLYDINYRYESDKIDLIWDESIDSRIAGSEIHYTDKNGNQQTYFFSTHELHGVIENLPAHTEGTLRHRTAYLPGNNSIDTLFSNYEEFTYTNRRAVFDSFPGWKFRCKVLVETKTIKDHGGPFAFKNKMDEALVRAGAKFRVSGLNDAGNNEIHFYMTEFIPFEGSSGQFRYIRGVDDPNMDILLIVNGNASGDDLSWGWLRTPYLTLGHDYAGLFGDRAVDALLHEFGHARGMYDLYLGEVPNGANNPINGQPFESKRCIMNYPYGETVWSEFSRFIINESAGEKVAKFYWDYFPENFHIDVFQKNGLAAIGAKLNFYPVFANSNAVRANDVVKYRATTGTNGRYTFPDNPYAIDQNVSNNVYNYLVQIEYNGNKEYRWMPMDDALIAGSKRQPFIFNIELSN